MFRVTQREPLFEDLYFGRFDLAYTEYDVDPRSGRFLMVKIGQAGGEAEIVVVVNWFEELRRRMGN